MKNKLLFLLVMSATFSFAQKAPDQRWFNLDLKKDKYPGVSSNKAYEELLRDKPKPVKPVIVAVIDGGTDISHADLKAVIWVNEKEIAGNGVDDDQNGYVDDVNGWSFIGGKEGDVEEDTYELTRMYSMLKSKYKDTDSSSLSPEEKKNYRQYLSIKKEYNKKFEESKKMSEMMTKLGSALSEIKSDLHTDTPTLEQVKNYKPGTPFATFAQKNLLRIMKDGGSFKDVQKQISDGFDYYNKGAKYSFNPDFNSRVVIGDNPDDPAQCCYGNNHITGPDGEHGTHVAGIIGAIRNNSVGIDGVAEPVRIMVLRVVPDGDERDKDVANAIRYAAANGASVINMSFGKSYSPYKYLVDDAVKFAESKDVLIVHAAGNDAKNTDEGNNFPRDTYDGSGGTAKNWIEVGASSWKKKKKYRAAEFSNYGKNNVDVFAPGVAIYSTLPNNTYGSYNGTSMAAPVTAGVAALVRAYYPNYTAPEIKDIIMKSVVQVKHKVIVPGTEKTKVKMTELCVTGGIVNVYNALKLAEELKKK